MFVCNMLSVNIKFWHLTDTTTLQQCFSKCHLAYGVHNNTLVVCTLEGKDIALNIFDIL